MFFTRHVLTRFGTPKKVVQKGDKNSDFEGIHPGYDLWGQDSGSSLDPWIHEVVRSLGTMANPWFVGFDQIGHPVEIP